MKVVSAGQATGDDAARTCLDLSRRALDLARG
jgi:hypothetical protein